MKINIFKYFTKRGIFTFLLWLLFLAALAVVYLYVNRWFQLITGFLICIVFGYLMTFRTKYLNNPQGSCKCHFGFHNIESENIDYMDGTGKFIGDVEVKIKRNKTKTWCTREFCDYEDWYYNW